MLVMLDLVHLSPNVSIAVTLHPSDKLEYNLITSLLKSSKSTSPEKDLGVTQAISLSGEFNLVQQSICASLVIRCIGNLSSTKDLVPRLEIRVQHPVGEASHTNPDTFQYTITSKLVHNQFRLNSSRLLVGVGHNATDEVRLSAVKSSHQSSKLNQETEETVLPPPPFFFFFFSSSGGADWPGCSRHKKTNKLLLDFFKMSTTVSLTGSLFFSSHPVTL